VLLLVIVIIMLLLFGCVAGGGWVAVAEFDRVAVAVAVFFFFFFFENYSKNIKKNRHSPFESDLYPILTQFSYHFNDFSPIFDHFFACF
jgi:hypothetical protein